VSGKILTTATTTSSEHPHNSQPSTMDGHDNDTITDDSSLISLHLDSEEDEAAVEVQILEDELQQEAQEQGHRKEMAQQQIQDANEHNLKNDHHFPDPTYKTWWKRFMRFIDEQQTANQVPRGDKYCTRTNVDLFFQIIIANYAAGSP
jgi:hypothetical protein